MQEQQLQEQAQKQESKKGKAFLFVLGLFLGVVCTGLFSAFFNKQHNNVATTVASEEKVVSDSVLDKETVYKLQSLEDGIDQYYLNEVDEESIRDSLYHGLVDGLGDPYSTYYSPEELQKMMEATTGIYYGIGAYISYDSEKDYCKVSKCMDGSPAEEAGLQPDDIIVEVDGKEMYKVQNSEIVTYIKGPEHTTVELTIYREGEMDYLHFTLERRKIETPTVGYEMYDNKIAYIQIAEFDEVTTDQFKDYLSQAEEEGMKGLIIDLRDNPGGSVQTVVAIGNELLPKGLVVYTEDKNGKRKEYSSSGNHQIQVPLVVLVNGDSASASEILAGAIKDYGVGTILGTTTFGKGIVQKIFSLTDGSALKLTISHYYTPKGNDIHKIGIVPDEELEFDRDAYLEDGTDNQLERAKEIIQKKID